MSGRRTRSAARLAGISAVLVLAAGSSATAAGPGAGDRAKAARLRVQAQLLDTKTHRALLDLYALESRLSTAQTRLGALQTLAADLRVRQQRLGQQLAAARQTLSASQQQLGDHLRSLYESGTVDPLAVVLGAQTLDEALTRLDDLSRLADQNRQIVETTSQAKQQLVRLAVALAAQQHRLDASLAAAQQTARQLASARSDRVAYVADLRSQQALKDGQIHDLLAAARKVVAKSQQIAARATSAPADPPSDGSGSTSPTAPTQTQPAPTAPPAAPAPSGRTIVVSATGYSLPGRTATGMPVGWGVVAVDPSVIPLGTKLSIPGYGTGVAADVGSGVRGATIDLWFPSLAQARAWGRRTVTITVEH